MRDKNILTEIHLNVHKHCPQSLPKYLAKTLLWVLQANLWPKQLAFLQAFLMNIVPMNLNAKHIFPNGNVINFAKKLQAVNSVVSKNAIKFTPLINNSRTSKSKSEQNEHALE